MLSDTITVISGDQTIYIDENARDTDQRIQKLRMIEGQATESWGKDGAQAVATRDFMTVIVKRRKE